MDALFSLIAGHAEQAGRTLASGAGQASKMIADKIKEKTAAPKYFYMPPGGTPKGPASLANIRVLVTQGALAKEAMLNEVGSPEWKPGEPLLAELDTLEQ